MDGGRGSYGMRSTHAGRGAGGPGLGNRSEVAAQVLARGCGRTLAHCLRREHDHRAAPPGAGQPGSQRAVLERGLDQRVGLGHGALVIIPQRLVTLDHEPADFGEIAAVQRGGGATGARGLGDDVTDAAVERRR